MRRPSRWRILGALAAMTCVSSPMAAQEGASSRRLALVIAGPAAVGLQIPITSRVALRPDLALTRTTFTVSGSESKLANVGVGLGVLIGLGERDGVRDGVQTYIAPRIALSRTTFDNGSISDLWFFDAAFGASSPITKRLTLFGEVGPRVTYTDQSTATVTNRTTNLVARAALGINLGF